MNKSNFIEHKTSCPKEFFAKLYGHLEDTEDKTKCSKKSENRDMLHKFQILNQVQKCSEDEKKKVFRNTKVPQTVPPPFPFFSNLLAKGLSGLCTDPAISSGIAKFLARRRRKEDRPRRQRTTFSNEQTLNLELEYHRSEYISRGRRFELAETLHLTEAQIKIWFQNRRAKDKRIEKAQIDQHYRNLLLTNGMPGLTFPRNLNFCGVCAYRSNILQNYCAITEKFTTICDGHHYYDGDFFALNECVISIQRPFHYNQTQIIYQNFGALQADHSVDA